MESEAETPLSSHRIRAACGRLLGAALICLALSAAGAHAEPLPGTIALYEQPGAGVLGAAATGADGDVWFTATAPAAIDRVDSNSTLSRFTVGLSAGSKPAFIARGPDGDVWFTVDGSTPAIGRVTPAGEIVEFSEGLPAGSHPSQIATGPDGNVWFTDDGSEAAIGQITPLGAITEFKTGLAPGSRPAGIATGPDGNVWFTDDGTTPAVGRVTSLGEITEFSTGLATGSAPGPIAAGPDGGLWFADDGSTPAIGHVTPLGGEAPLIEELSSGLQAGSVPGGIATGADGSLWFTDDDALSPALGRITVAGAITELMAPLTSGEHLPQGLTAGADARLWFGVDSEAGRSVAAATTGPPAGTAAPVLSGPGIFGSPERCEGAGWPQWNGSPPSLSAFGFDGYSWQLDGATIEGASGETYVPPSADAGHELSCRVTATYPLPSVTEIAASEAITLGVPRIESTPTPPSASGTLAVSPGIVFSAAKASCGGAAWSAGAVGTQWLLDGAPIAGAGSASYTPPRSDDGHGLTCRQTATSPDGSSSLTSPARTIHEQPPQPAWPTGTASRQCSSPVCMQSGEPGAGGEAGSDDGSYPQDGAWLAAAQVRCVSAPWASAAGDSTLPAVHSLAQAHTIRMTLQRMTSSGPVTIASQELTGLGSARDTIDNLPSEIGSPFGGTVAASYGSIPFAAGELWAQRFPGAIGQPDWLVAGQGRLLFDVFGGAGVEGSFQLLYNLTAADLGARLRCVAGADDGPLGVPTRAVHTSPEYTVSSSPRCAPQRLAGAHGPQPAAIVVGALGCLHAPSGLAGLGGGPAAIAVGSAAMRLSLYCGLTAGCRGKLALDAAVGRRGVLAHASITLGHGRRSLVQLVLDGEGRRLLRAKGRAGLATDLTLTASGHPRRLLSPRLFGVG